jgi:hypothetical protein
VCRTDSTPVIITRLEAERTQEESVETSETSEPPKTQLVKETSTFLSFLRMKDMVAVEQGSCKGFERWSENQIAGRMLQAAQSRGCKSS